MAAGPSAPPGSAGFQSGLFNWVPVDTAQLDGVSFDAVTTMADGRWLAVGRSLLAASDGGAGWSSTAWASPDGRSWGRLRGSPPFTASTSGWNAVVLDVARVGSGYVAVGMNQAGDGSSADASAWYSADGASWTRAPVADGTGRTMDQVVITKDGLVALGEAGYSIHAGVGFGTAIWTSPDGRAWTRLPDTASPPLGTRLSGVAAVSGAYLAAASFERPWGGGQDQARPVTAGIWRSADAVHWAPVEGSPIGVAALAERAGLVAVGSGPAGSPERALAWQSTGGSAWTGGPLPQPLDLAADAGVGAWTVVNALDGMLAIGGRAEDPYTMVAWSSADGKAWLAGSLPLAPGTTFYRAFAVQGAVLVVGEVQPDTGSVPEMWLVSAVLRFHAPVVPSGSPAAGVDGASDVPCPGTSPCGP